MQSLSITGPATVAQVAHNTTIDRTTTYRLLGTLHQEGYVFLNEGSREYSLTFTIRQIADGFTDIDFISQIVASKLGKLLTNVQWPSDFAITSMGEMIIRESTHRYSLYSIHRSMIGRSRSLFDSALGKAVISAASEEDREQYIEFALKYEKTNLSKSEIKLKVQIAISEFQTNGYASSVDGTGRGISAIALPVQNLTNVIGAVNIIFFTSVLRPRQAASRFLPALT
ncbi:MAG: transcriptional regulator [Rhodobacteraceae bacterium]|nr:MAG: transcriptional regulator [Paracoccaceae bacterium]